MNEKFKKLKKRAQLYVLIKSLIVGVSVALFLTGIVLLATNLAKSPIFWAWYLAIAAGGLLLGGGLSWYLFRVTDQRLARELDESVGRERIQTALAYGDTDSDICKLQRTDAAERLAPVNLAFKKLWVFVTVPIFACSVFLCGNLVGLIDSKVPPEDPAQITDWQASRLSDLIVYVRQSDADAETKEGTVAELYKLVNLEQMGVPASQLGNFVKSAIENIRTVYTTANENYTSGEQETEADRTQKQTNYDVCEYVIRELYRLFEIDPEGFETDNPENPDNPDNPETPDDPDKPENPGSDATGSKQLFFDPEKGYVYYDDVSSAYRSIIEKAMDSNLVSSDDWADIVMMYFMILDGVR